MAFRRPDAPCVGQPSGTLYAPADLPVERQERDFRPDPPASARSPLALDMKPWYTVCRCSSMRQSKESDRKAHWRHHCISNPDRQPKMQKCHHPGCPEVVRLSRIRGHELTCEFRQNRLRSLDTCTCTAVQPSRQEEHWTVDCPGNPQSRANRRACFWGCKREFSNQNALWAHEELCAKESKANFVAARDGRSLAS